LGRTIGDKVGNLKRGGRLERVKPSFPRIKPLKGAMVRTVSCTTVSPREVGPERALVREEGDPWRGTNPREQRAPFRPKPVVWRNGSAIG
jgi:hypothetical protein